MKYLPVPACAILMMLLLAGCMQSANLADQTFTGKRIALVYEAPEAPFADFNMTIFDKVGQEIPSMNQKPEGRSIPALVLDRMESGERVPEPVSKVHHLIDSVLVDYDMSRGVVESSLERSASVLGLSTVTEEEMADYLLEIVVDDYGIGADAWHSTAYFEVMGQIKLLDRETGRKIWAGDVMEITPLSRALITVGIPAGDKETPAALSQISVEEMRDVLDGLATYASIQLIAPLKEAYQRHRNREHVQFESRFLAGDPTLPSSLHGQ